MRFNKIDLLNKDQKQDYIIQARQLPSWQLSDRQICDLELILNGSFSPLEGFMGKKDYESVLENMRLNDGTLSPIPITLDITEEFAKTIKDNNKITLRDKEGFPLAILTISDLWRPNINEEAKIVYKTNDITHPGVHYLKQMSNEYYLGGVLIGIQLPHHYDYINLRHTPNEIKSIFKNNKWKKIVGFQTRNPLHRAHIQMTINASNDLNSKLLLHPVVGMTKPGDIDHHTRVRCYKYAMEKYPKDLAILSLLPLAMRMAGPREALWHALIRKNYGCTHLIVGRDHAGPGKDKNGNVFYNPYDAQELLLSYQNEIGIDMVPFKFMVYMPSKGSYSPIDEIDKNIDYKTISGTELREILDRGREIPEWFTYPKIAKELQKSHPPLNERGFTIFFTGLSGSGKSTLAKGLLVKLLEHGSRPVTLLDGDIVRTHLSNELGFSKKHRSINIQRIGFVASEITKNGGIAICAPIAPYESDRKLNKDLISKYGAYIEIYVNTPIEKCEERDAKGLYALAREGKIEEFTGISDPYEEPISPEIIVNSSEIPPEELVNEIYMKIVDMGYLKK